MRFRALSAVAAAAPLFVFLSSTTAQAVGFHPGGTDPGVEGESAHWTVEVRGEVVSATLEMAFTTATPGDLAGELRFPLPPGAVLRGAEVWIAAEERWESAESLGRQEAENAYTEALEDDAARDPLLVQQIGRDAYRALVYPIAADEECRVRVHYAHLLEGAGAERGLRIALRNADTEPLEVDDVTIDVRVVPDAWDTGSWTVPAAQASDELTFSSAAGQARAHLTELPLADDVVLELVPASPLPRASAFGYRSAHEKVTPHTVVRWAPDMSDVEGADETERDVVFVIDTSGSMDEAKLTAAKAALRAAIAALDEEDRYGIVSFGSEAVTQTPALGTVEVIGDSAALIDGLRNTGGTNLSEGLAQGAILADAADERGRVIDLVVLTDGNPTVGPAQAEDILGYVADRRAQGTTQPPTALSAGTGCSHGPTPDAAKGGGDRDLRVNALGVGYDLDQRLINALAQRTGGEATFALEDALIEGQFLTLFERVRGGGLSEGLVDVGGAGDEGVVAPLWRVFPDDILALGARDEEPSEVDLALEGRTGGGDPVELADRASEVAVGESGVHLAVPALAAKAWADALERRADREGETADLLAEAVVLAKTYGIVTRYSGLLALDRPESYAAYGIDRPERDAAGVAVDEVVASSADETRIGGAGYGGYGGGGYGGSGGCSCVPDLGTSWPGLIAAFFAALAWRRRRCDAPAEARDVA